MDHDELGRECSPKGLQLEDRPPETQKDLLHELAKLRLPMPRTTRELFHLFALYNPAEGLAGLLRRLDFADVKPHQIYQVAHGRAPESIELVVPRQGYD